MDHLSGGWSAACPAGSDQLEAAQEVAMRGFDCVPPDDSHKDTIHLEGKDDEALLAQALRHTAQYHSALGVSEEQLREIIAKGAYDVEPAARI
jgi:hypothetical protein